MRPGSGETGCSSGGNEGTWSRTKLLRNLEAVRARCTAPRLYSLKLTRLQLHFAEKVTWHAAKADAKSMRPQSRVTHLVRSVPFTAASASPRDDSSARLLAIHCSLATQ